MTRRYQLRLTMMLVALAVVLCGMKFAGRAEFWAGVFPDQAEESATDPAGIAVEHTTLRPELTSAPESKLVRLLPQRLRDTIQDNVLGVKSDESRAYDVALGMAGELHRQLSEEQKRQLPRARYALWMDAPEDCRGRAFRLQGTLRRLTRVELQNPDLRFRNVLDAWVSLPDSGEGLVHVVALSADEDLPLLTQMGPQPPEVELTGYFFKREAYASHADSGLSIAPLVLAGAIERVPLVTTTNARSEQLTPWLTWLAVVTCGGLAMMLWMFAASDTANRGQRTHELTRLPAAPSFDDIDAESPYELLSSLEERARAAPPEFRLE